jgi:membrane protein CcdC involved in cytochrome C biogenesis
MPRTTHFLLGHGSMSSFIWVTGAYWLTPSQEILEACGMQLITTVTLILTVTW